MSVKRRVNEQITVSRLVTIPVTEVEERTYRALIETPHGGSYNIHVEREIVVRDPDGSVLDAQAVRTPTHRLASAIAGESVTLADGTVVPAALIFAALPLFFDRWAEEDIAAGRR